MKFDKNKILTAITADQTKIGMKGWFGECEEEIVHNLEYKPSAISEINRSRAYAFRNESDSCIYPFFYPAPEPTYADRQAQWVKENNIKVGTKVSVTRAFTSCEDGCYMLFAPIKGTLIGDDCTVVDVVVNDEYYAYILVHSKQKNDCWRFPYFVLEVVPEEPWFKLGDKVRITIKSSEAYNKIGTVTNTHVHRDGTQTVYLSFEEFWDTKAFNADSKEKIGELYTPTYAERQAEWIKANSVKVGTRVRFTKGFDAESDGSSCCEHRDAKGKKGSVNEIFDTYISVVVEGDYWVVPFTSLEVVKEPTYRPYNNDELNDLVGEVLTSKFSGRPKLVTGRPKQKTQVNLDGKPFTAEILLQYYYRNKTEPCGIKEEV